MPDEPVDLTPPPSSDRSLAVVWTAGGIAAALVVVIVVAMAVHPWTSTGRAAPPVGPAIPFATASPTSAGSANAAPTPVTSARAAAAPVTRESFDEHANQICTIYMDGVNAGGATIYRDVQPPIDQQLLENDLSDFVHTAETMVASETAALEALPQPPADAAAIKRALDTQMGMLPALTLEGDQIRDGDPQAAQATNNSLLDQSGAMEAQFISLGIANCDLMGTSASTFQLA